MKHRPYGLLAELTHRCPLHCPYCSNPEQAGGGAELTAEEWGRVLEEAAALGILHAGFSGGEPLVRRDLEAIIEAARSAGLYTNLITSGVGLTNGRAEALQRAGLQSVQISFQADESPLADHIAGAPAHQRKIEAAAAVRTAGMPLSLNVVIHRHNIGRIEAIIDFAASLGAERLEVAQVQFYGWAFRNRRHLLPAPDQIAAARETAEAAMRRHAGSMAVIYVLPDLYETRPKPCMHGWGRRYLTVRPNGEVLPCPTAGAIPDLRFESVRERPLPWIWHESESFNRFRGTEWMPEPCRSCAMREIDFGGCRCQAALLTGDAAATDPVCELSANRRLIDAILEEAAQQECHPGAAWTPRINPR